MKRYFYSTLLGLLAANLGVALLVFAIDPANRFGNNRLGVYHWAEREFKESALARANPDAIFLANSKLSTLDPKSLGGYDWFNLAIGGAAIEDIVGYARLHADELKVCVIAVDFWMFRDETPLTRKVYHPPSIWKWLGDYLWSTTSLRLSFEAMIAAMKGEPKAVLPEGYINPVYFAHLVEHRGKTNPAAWYDWFEQNLIEGYLFSQDKMKLLRELTDELESKGVTTIVYLHPQHEAILEWLREPRIAEEYFEFRKAMQEQFPDAVDLTESVYSPAENYYTKDIIHYKPEISRRIFQTEILPLLDESNENPRR